MTSIRHYILTAAALATLTTGCTEAPTEATLSHQPPALWPDIAGVTIPAGIAPLNFSAEGAEKAYAVIKGERGGEMRAGGDDICWDVADWHELTDRNRGADLTLSVSTKEGGRWTTYADVTIHVSEDPLNDYGLTYRKIAPGYETFGDIGIYQRDIHTFDESAIVTSNLLRGQCVNCHTANRCDPKWLTLHVRGKHSGTLVATGGKSRWMTTKTDSTISNCMYPYWHPSGDYCAYSLSLVSQCFMTGSEKFIEVFDKAADACVMDVRTGELILSPLLQTPDLEVTPAFSADGKTIYYCTAKPQRLPADADKLRYNLCAIGFDAASGRIGDKVDTILDASAMGKSASWPRPSYDGRFIMYCLTNYGYFPVDHKEADLWIMNLADGTTRPATAANSADTESFHNWSSNSRWVVFSSRREDGQTSLAYIAHVDTMGNVGKPFLLPQRHPREYYAAELRSFNTPDFTTERVKLDPKEVSRAIFSDERERATVKSRD
ncbi:MAG: TolB family protein [Marinilabiliaceae bacterium]